ncbi:ankyrin repeat domain-containing protein 50-like [Haliotis asinina]|uniref:ankyrin repeat domain-containing protein 50-like n=1 Tax=Haliotis asinina TaxID=109174 RepID=UPI003532133B
MRPQSASALLRGPPLCLSDVMKMGYLQQVRDLVDLGMNIDSRDVDGKTPLMLCALMEPQSWGIGIARHLIENGANLTLRDKAGLNALHYACIYERDELVKVFLHAIDFDLNQTDKHGNTALHYCVQSGNADMVKLLVEHLQRYGLTLEKENKAGITARSLAQKLTWAECVEILSDPEKEVEDEVYEKQREIEKYEVTSEKNEIDDTRSQKDETYVARSDKSEKYEIRSDGNEKDEVRSEKNERGEVKSEKNEKDEIKSEKGEKDELSNEKNEQCGLSSHKSVLSLSLTESNLKSFSEETSSTRQPQRPQTALLKRRRTSTASSASSLSSGGRSQASMKCTPRNKAPKRCFLPNAKNEDSIIRCVSLSDFRNTKEYVFKLTAVPYDGLEVERGLPSIRRPQSAWTPRREAAYHADTEPFSWRTELKKLYVEYEFQCSPSWRDAAKTIADQLPLTPPSPLPQPDEAEEDKAKDRKGRRSSLTVKSQLSVESFKDKRRPSGNIKLRKLSTSGAPTPHMKGVDGALASSSESLNSSNSSKKKDGLGIKGDTTASKSQKMTPSDKEASLKGPKSLLSIPAVTETLVGDTDNDENTSDDAALTDSNRLSVLSDIDEDS